QMMCHYWRVVGAADVKHQPVAGDAEMQLERPWAAVDRCERIFLEQIVDGDGALVLDIGAGTADRILIEDDPDQAGRFSAGGALGAGHRGLKRIATERACASSPSASASVIAA